MTQLVLNTRLPNVNGRSCSVGSVGIGRAYAFSLAIASVALPPSSAVSHPDLDAAHESAANAPRKSTVPMIAAAHDTAMDRRARLGVMPIMREPAPRRSIVDLGHHDDVHADRRARGFDEPRLRLQ